jgi:hypothetical protein
VRIEAHLVAVTEGQTMRRLRPFLAEESDRLRAIPAEVAASLLPDPVASRATRTLGLPPLDLLDGQTGTVSTGAQVRYLADYEVSGSMVYTSHPVVASISEGVRVSVTARRSKDPARLTLQVDARCADLRRPVEIFRTKLRESEPAQAIQLAELRILELRDTAELPMRGWLLGRIGASEGDGHDRLLLLRAMPLPPPTVTMDQPGAAPAPGGGGASCGK